jgi:hypothetical protein
MCAVPQDGVVLWWECVLLPARLRLFTSAAAELRTLTAFTSREDATSSILPCLTPHPFPCCATAPTSFSPPPPPPATHTAGDRQRNSHRNLRKSSRGMEDGCCP